jgi:hypothetical protein
MLTIIYNIARIISESQKRRHEAERIAVVHAAIHKLQSKLIARSDFPNNARGKREVKSLATLRNTNVD